MSQRQGQAGDARKACRDPHAPAPMPVDERRPKPLETPGEGELVEMTDVDQACAVDPQIDRHRLVDQTKRKARRKSDQGDPAEADSKRGRNGGLTRGREPHIQRQTASSNMRRPSRIAMRPKLRSRSRERVRSLAFGGAAGRSDGSVVLMLLGGR